MAYDTIILENPSTGQIKEAPIGFSWTMFFFGFIPPMIRGDWKWFGITLGLGVLLALISLGLLGWLPSLIGAFIWNKSYLNGLIGRGFRVKSAVSGDIDRVDAVLGYRAARVEGNLPIS